MTSRVLTPWWTERPVATTGEATGSTKPTRILDYTSTEVRSLASRLKSQPHGDPRGRLQEAHSLIVERVRPVYALNDMQPVSRTVRRGRGSCSQRLAILEAIARSTGIPTRSHGLLIDGRFWYPRFPRSQRLVPSEIVLAWPEFLIEDTWISASQLFGDVQDLAQHAEGFSNSDGETLFDALSRTAVDWEGSTSTPGSCSSCDLSAHVIKDLGRVNSRDELFDAYGQTLCWGARTIGEPIMSRSAARSR